MCKSERGLGMHMTRMHPVSLESQPNESCSNDGDTVAGSSVN